MNKELVIHLIQEQIRNKLLMNSLEDLGFDCTSYTLCISEQILTLAGFQEKTTQLYQWYFDLLDNALAETNYWNLDEMLGKRSMKIYDALIDSRSDEDFLQNENLY
jgi:hypothetical protein